MEPDRKPRFLLVPASYYWANAAVAGTLAIVAGICAYHSDYWWALAFALLAALSMP
jgi:hypothetical protein